MLSLLNKRNFVFPSPFYSLNFCSTFTEVPQKNCLDPVLFNVYMPIILKHISLLGNPISRLCWRYSHFFLNKSFNSAIEDLNSAFIYLKPILINVSLEFASEKCKSVIITKRRYLVHSNILLDDNIIPFLSYVTYLGIILDPKLRWHHILHHFQPLLIVGLIFLGLLRILGGVHIPQAYYQFIFPSYAPNLIMDAYFSI